MAGRRPEPLEKRAAKGNTSGRPMPKDAPQRVAAIPESPAWLVGSARECWDRTSALLFARGQFTADCEMSLIALCQCYAEWVELAEDIRINGRFQKVRTTYASKGAKDGDIDDDAAYMERVRPAVAAFQDCDRRLKGWLIEFGLTDASRGKVSAAPPEGDGDAEDPLARYGLN